MGVRFPHAGPNIMKQKFIDAYMKTAEIFAELSSAKRLHVGALVVKDDRIISIGYNGMPSGWDNVCEFREYTLGGLAGFLDEDGSSYNLKTKPEVLHAESNAIAKLAKSTESGDGATMFITTLHVWTVQNLYTRAVLAAFYTATLIVILLASIFSQKRDSL